MNTDKKRFLKGFGISMAGYTAMVPVSIWLLKGHEHSPLRYFFAVLPVIPAAFAMWATIGFVRSLDEFQRRLHVEGMAFSFLGTCLISLTWGFLQNAGLPHADVIWVTPLLVLLWAIGLKVASWRYR
jgi:hypothetical protein